MREKEREREMIVRGEKESDDMYVYEIEEQKEMTEKNQKLHTERKGKKRPRTKSTETFNMCKYIL